MAMASGGLTSGAPHVGYVIQSIETPCPSLSQSSEPFLSSQTLGPTWKGDMTGRCRAVLLIRPGIPLQGPLWKPSNSATSTTKKRRHGSKRHKAQRAKCSLDAVAHSRWRAAGCPRDPTLQLLSLARHPRNFPVYKSILLSNMVQIFGWSLPVYCLGTKGDKPVYSLNSIASLQTRYIFYRPSLDANEHGTTVIALPPRTCEL